MPLNINLHRKEITISVSELAAEVEFLGMSGLVAINQRLASGREQHEVLQQKRAQSISGYQSEAVVKFRWPFQNFTFIIQGRVDGIYEADGTLVVEEIKTVILSESQFSNLTASSYPNYLNQVRIYCYLLEQAQALPCQGRLHFINLTNNTEFNLPADYDGFSVQQYVEGRFAEIMADVEERQRWQHERLVMADKLDFPFSESRQYQDDLLDTVGGALFGATDCMISAPTGIGKTAGALFPALQFALATGRRIFYVTSKTTQQKIVQETLAQFNQQQDIHLRAVTLRAKEKMCPQDVMLCHPSFCPLLEQYSQKMNDGNIVRTVLEAGNLVPEAIHAAGLKYGVCPFELSLDLTLHADIVIGDYNYVFDPRVALKRFFATDSYDNLILIIDEAHNLLSRGRDYYSPSLNWDSVQEVLAISEREHFDVFSELGHIYQQIDAIFRNLNQQYGNKLNKFSKALIELPRPQIRKLAEELGEKMLNYFMFKKQTQLFLARDPIDTFYYQFVKFAQVLQMEGEEFSYLLDGASADISLRILCHDPANELHQRISG
ncbi:hypothetical protein KAH55_04650, partial [bacterium]|nr:hypothetical protein [bacterium]